MGKQCSECGKPQGKFDDFRKVSKSLGIEDPDYLVCIGCKVKERKFECRDCGNMFTGKVKLISLPKCPRCEGKNVAAVPLTPDAIDAAHKQSEQREEARRVQFALQLRKGALETTLAQIIADFEEALKKENCTVESSAEKEVRYKNVMGWQAEAEVMEKDELFVFRVTTSRGTGKAAGSALTTVVSGTCMSIVCLPLGLCKLIGATEAFDKEGTAVKNDTEKAVKRICEKRGLTIFK